MGNITKTVDPKIAAKDTNGDGHISLKEYEMDMEFKRKELEDADAMRDLTLKINDILVDFFMEANLILVDYKLEFGKFNGKMLLADEFTPDGCRLWDKDTLTKMDKDRFRQDLGNVIETYGEVGERLGMQIKLD